MGEKKEAFPTSQIFQNFKVPRIEKHLLSVLKAILYLIFTLFFQQSFPVPAIERERERVNEIKT